MNAGMMWKGLMSIPLVLTTVFTLSHARPHDSRNVHPKIFQLQAALSASSGSRSHLNTVLGTSGKYGAQLPPVIHTALAAFSTALSQGSLLNSTVDQLVIEAGSNPRITLGPNPSATTTALPSVGPHRPDHFQDAHATRRRSETPLASKSSLSVSGFDPLNTSGAASDRSKQATASPNSTLSANSDEYVNPKLDASLRMSFFTPEPRVVPRELTSSSNPFGGAYGSFKLGTLSTTPTTSTASSSSAPSSSSSSGCPAGNGTRYASKSGINYEILCDIDFPGQDYPFQLVSSFDDCVTECDSMNDKAGETKCFAALYVPSRKNDANDCYLKSSVNDPTHATLAIDGALLLMSLSSVSSTSSSQSASSTTASSTPTSPSTASASATSSAEQSSGGLGSSVNYASGSSVIAPKVVGSTLQGATENKPTTQYIDWKPPADLTLSENLLVSGVDGSLSTAYPMSLDTGVLEYNSSTAPLITSLSDVPHISRDGGKGGSVNGQNLFVFCDTGAYSITTDTSNGEFLGFMSSSVAVDTGMNGLNGQPIYLQDGIGQWSDNVGRMRGFSPMTEGEQSYNLVMQGNGQRYAVWPESSIIPYDAENGLIYAPIVYDNVNMTTKAAVFTYTGNTLLTVTAGGKGGPVAQRTTDKLFYEGEVEWGSCGGIRSWGSSGIGGEDGKVYIFGNVQGGLLVGRTDYGSVGNRDSYEYWTGTSWSNGMPSTTSTAYMISGSFMDVDVFYSPRHLTFIAVYMTIWADNTFYYRYLDAGQAVLPSFAPGGDSSSDFVENLVKYNWSEEYTLYKASPGLSGKYCYSGGFHYGYYGADDIINGGSKMLLSWTAPTGGNPASMESEYQIMTAEVDFD